MTQKIIEFIKKSREIEAGATSGPWKCGMENSGSIFGDLNTDHDGDNPYIGTVHGVGLQLRGLYEGERWDFGLPNAKLIAHSRNTYPKLLNALEIAVKALKDCNYYSPDKDTVRYSDSALKKIEKELVGE